MRDQMGKDTSKIREVRVVTFDLDNTLWNTSACIDAANDALAAYLDSQNIIQPKRVEKVMGDLFKADKPKYAPLAENATAPVLLTRLRIDAVQHILQTHNGYSDSDSLEMAETAFELWTNERHKATTNNLASDVLETLESIRSIQTLLGDNVVIGAITDGNSNPDKIESLNKYFDFCINAESIGVGKPDKRVFLEAVRYIGQHPSFQDLKLRYDSNESELEGAVGPYWVHVGDDFVKDVVAASTLNMKTIWAIELIRDKLGLPTGEQEKKTTNKKEEDDDEVMKDFIKRVSGQSVIKMAIGADDYLVDSVVSEFVDMRVDRFAGIAETIIGWDNDGKVLKEMKVAATEDITQPPMFALADTAETTEDTTEKDSAADEVGSPTLQPKKATDDNSSTPPSDTQLVAPRVFRIAREDCNVDVPAPLLGRDSKTMKTVMMMAQQDKTSGVFSFPPEQVEALQEQKMALMVKIGNTGQQFSREIFSAMTVQEVLSFTDDDTVTLSLSMKETATTEAPSVDLF